MSSFTRVDNWLFDEVMPAAKPNTYKVVCAVVRMTAGWRRERAEMSFSDLHELTGITGRSTLADAVADAIGAHVTVLPLTPERVLEAVRRHKG